MSKRLFRLTLIGGTFCALLLTAGCGQGNLFSWAHSPGSNSGTTSLTSDANTALQNKDYAKAIEYFQKLVDQDAANSDAQYGLAVAQMGSAGLDIGSLVANLIKQQGNNPSVPGLAAAIARTANLSSPADIHNILPPSIVSNPEAMLSALNKAIPHLTAIVRGRTRTISYDDPNVNLNLAFCLLLRAALIVNQCVVFDTNYNVSINPSVSQQQLASSAETAAEDIASGFYLIYNYVMPRLHLSTQDQSTINNIRNDIQQLYNQYHDQVNTWAQQHGLGNIVTAVLTRLYIQ